MAVNLRQVLFRVPRDNPAGYNLQGQHTRKQETKHGYSDCGGLNDKTERRSENRIVLDAAGVRFKLSLRRASVVNSTVPLWSLNEKIKLRRKTAPAAKSGTSEMAAYGRVYCLRSAGDLIITGANR